MIERILSYLLILCWIQAGWSLVQITIPDSGTNIVGDPGDENITLFCELTLSDGTEQATSWSLMTDGQTGETGITFSDSRFLIVGDPLESDPAFSSNTNLTIRELTEELNNAVIYCGVPDENLLAINFTIRLYTPPSLTDQGTVSLAEGDITLVDLSNTTVAKAFPLPVGDQITWMRDGSVVSSDSRVTYGYPSVMFRAPGVQRSDTGPYELSATNTRADGSEIGSDTGSFTLVVYFGPDLVPGDDRVPVAEGGDVTLVCGTDLQSNPSSSIEWRDNSRGMITDGGRYTFANDTSEVSLRIESVTPADAGDWRCIITVMADGRTIGTRDQNVTLFVVVPAATPTDVIAQEIVGTTILVCWQQSSDVGTAGVTRYRVLFNPTDVIEIQMIETPDNDTFFNVTGLLPVTEYEFRVQAVTEYVGITVVSNISDPGFGNTSTSVPAPVCNMVPISSNGVITVTWDYTHTGGLAITEVIVQYRVDPGDSDTFQDIPNGNLPDPSLQTLAVSGLIAGRVYVFRVTTSNDIGSTSVDCMPVTHLVGIPQTPEVVMVEPAGGGDVNVVIRIPDVPNIPNIPVDTVTFTVRAILISSGEEVFTTNITVNTYRYGTTIGVEIRGQVLIIGENYMFTVSVRNRFGSSGTSQPVTMEVEDTPVTPLPSTSPTPDNSGSGIIIGGAVGGAVGGAIVITVALIIIITVLKKQCARERHPQVPLKNLPQKKEAIVDLPLTSTAAHNPASFSGYGNDPTLSQNIAYRTTQGKDMDTNEYDVIETAGVVAPGSFTETPLYESL